MLDKTGRMYTTVLLVLAGSFLMLGYILYTNPNQYAWVMGKWVEVIIPLVLGTGAIKAGQKWLTKDSTPAYLPPDKTTGKKGPPLKPAEE